MVLKPLRHSRFFSLVALVALNCFAAGCAASLGPGYAIDKQEISVQFVPDSGPSIRVDASYHLRNNGNQPLTSLELRLPGRRRFHFSQPTAEWDTSPLSFTASPDNPRNVLLTFPQPWPVAETHTLHLSVEYLGAAGEGNNLTFASDAFFLPAQGWSPELLPARGILATGGIPPKRWSLVATVPDGFLVHMSGDRPKISRSGGKQTLTAVQRTASGYPFVIAGRYAATRLDASQVAVNLWARAPQNAGALRQPGDPLLQAIQAYNSLFGDRKAKVPQLWLVECPAVTGCFSSTTFAYGKWIFEENQKTSAEMASLDSAMIDISTGAPDFAAAGPSLASSWLGYDQNPGFFDQDPPLSALPAFAAATGRESIKGPQVREQTIRRTLQAIPAHPESRAPESDDAIRAKSLLFFYGLEDRWGRDTFGKAMRHMLYARSGGGFDIHDLIAAFEQETHENAAQFVRLWMKHPGVPAEFRARYENSSGSAALTSKEITP